VVLGSFRKPSTNWREELGGELVPVTMGYLNPLFNL
jgi:hypothetical protein